MCKDHTFLILFSLTVIRNLPYHIFALSDSCLWVEPANNRGKSAMNLMFIVDCPPSRVNFCGSLRIVIP